MDTRAIRERFVRYIGIALLVIGIAFIVAFFITRRLQQIITTPIFSLAHTAARIAREHDYKARATKYGDDEVGDLTDAFNKMLEQIEAQNEEILSFNYALEQKVAKRTRQLEEINAEIRLKNEFIETVIDASVDVLVVFDKELRFVMLNKRAREVYGSLDNNLIGKKMVEVFPQVKDSDMHKDLKEAFEGKTIHNSNYKSKVIDKVFENYFIPLHEKDGSVYRVMAIGHDITEIMEANNQLKDLNEQLEKSNNELEQFAYITSHDLQEPLRKISIFSDLAAGSLNDPTKASEHLLKVSSSAARMSELITDVLDYSRVTAERGDFEMVDITTVINTICSDFEFIIKEKNAEVRYNWLPKVHGNKLQLSQLFMNLLNNALKFTNKGPVIEIRATIVKASDIPDLKDLYGGYFHELTVTDNGIGFDQQYASRIFTVFQRLHSRDRYPGTGIGLAICKKIVDNHNGVITVTSKPGEGTTFYIYLPAGEEIPA